MRYYVSWKSTGCYRKEPEIWRRAIVSAGASLLVLSLTVEMLQGKTCQTSLLSAGVGQFEPKFQGEGVVPGEYFFLVSTKLDTFCYPTVQTAPCYVPSF